ncbi:hypothetical protein SLE2022_265420 [Rubroshorea leprosula]
MEAKWSTVESYFSKDPTIVAGLLRLHFHDCFVQGCDGSVLIIGSFAERNALPNLGLRGIEVIDDAKSQIETLCPGVVSCADILALVAQDAVDLLDGTTSKRDGRISSSSQTSRLHSPLDSITVQRQKFAAKHLDDHDLVTLADKDSPIKFDASFFKNVRDGNGVLESDQRLGGDAATRSIVQNYAGNIRGLLGFRFDFEFGKAMIKWSSIEVKTGTQGEIRKVCSKFN